MLNLRYTWSPFLTYGQLIKVKENTVIYHQGEDGKGFYYLSNGEIQITILSDKGEERTVNYVPEGMLFGENGINNEPYSTTAITASPSVLYYFSDEALLKVCKEHPNAATIFTNSLIYKFRLLAEIITLLDSPIEQQMAHYLLKLVNENGKFAINQTAFARYVGTSRITVNKIIQKWVKNDIIKLSSQTIDIIDINKIREIQRSDIKNLPNLDMLILSSSQKQ
ncbi:Crp/Fnr family transcriptional regulator [Peribacillus asahii]|uniref:Crp/Fnr family transcriptional regulator n=1 Tax=Peribacillus asahii TaxID=228899 RepID=A0A3T0KLJ9_9BACI|nr:Crp/Fnr family transcriptional regulator [Peribacillus asahii]AZV41134.1 Crp/Fnr family transcriptional regulator [Peribacillus asahii]